MTFDSSATGHGAGGKANGLRANSALPVLLLADDNRIVCKIITKILASHAVRIHHVGRGDEALAALMSEDFALALIDAHLSVMDGLSVTKHYRFAAVGRKRVPILGLVGAGTADQIGACINAGMDGCLAKPIDPSQLVEIVKSFVSAWAAPELAPATLEPRVDADEAPQIITTLDKTAEDTPLEDKSMEDLPTVNLQVLRDLEQLGGRSFVEDVVSQFVTDAHRIFPELAASIKNADVESSRDLLHALRSCAANVGASSIFELCLAWREIDIDELVERGEACLSRLELAFDHACLSMRDYGRPAETGGPVN
jgi:two-component system sensor histidine kinase RpfC